MKHYEKAVEVDFNPFRDGELVTSVPTTESQKEIWSSIEIDSRANLCYNESIRIRLEGPLDFDLLEVAFNETLAKRDSLRASFSPRGKDFMVGVHTPRKIPFFDYSNEKNKYELVKRHAQKCAEHLFDLNTGPLFIAELVKLNEDEHLLFLTGHHLVCDGWSMALIVSDISKFYKAISRGEDIANISRAPNFFEYALKAERKQGGVPRYWPEEFKEIPPDLNLPLNYKRPEFRTYESRRVDYELDSKLIKDSRKFAAQNKKSLYQLLLANFGLLLNTLTKQKEIVVGISSAGQSVDYNEDLVGHLVNLLPIKFTFYNGMPYSEIFELTKEKMLNAFDAQDATFGEIIKELNLKRDPSRIPLVSVIFNVDQQYSGQGMDFGELRSSYESNPRTYENFEIFINATILDDRCVLECQYNTNLFAENTIVEWLELYESLLTRAIHEKELTAAVNEHSFSAEDESLAKEDSLGLENISEGVKNAKKVWEEVLGLHDIPLKANFFTIGGHSLLGVDVCHRAKEEFGVNVKLKDLLERPTLVEFSKFFEDANTSETEKLNKHVHTSFQLTKAQKQTLFWEKLNPENNGVYHLPAAIRIRTSVDRARLENAFIDVVNAHPSLRAFVNKNTEQETVPSEHIDFSLESAEVSIEEAIETMNALSKVPFDLSKAPLMRAQLFKLDEDDFIIYINFHHIVFDGWSFDIFFRDLDLAYRGESLPQEELEYLDFADWQNDYINSNKFEDDLEAWRKKLSGELPRLNLPTDKSRTEVISTEAGEVKFEIPKHLVNEINHFSKEKGVSVYSLLMACYNQALMDYSQMDEVIVGLPVRGRNSSKYLNTIGYFVNGSVIRTKRENTPSELINSVREEVAWALSYQDTPFSEIARSLNIASEPGVNPIYQAFFSFQDINGRSQQFNGEKYSQINIDCAHASVDLNMWVKASTERIEGAIAFRKDLFEKASIQHFFNYFINLVEYSLANSDESWSQFKPAGLMKLYQDINNTKVRVSMEDLPSQVDHFAQISPSKVAISTQERSITYEELKKYSESIAQQLLEMEIERGDLVGLVCERDVNAPIFYLGVLKAGCGYVPMDPGFPVERLEYIAKNSGVKIIIAPEAKKEQFKVACDHVMSFSEFDFTKPLHQRPGLNLESIAYVIYTSGSTGLPKGVQLSRRSMNNFLCSMAKTPGMSSRDTMLAVTTFSFDISVLEIFLPLMVGGRLVIASKSNTMSGEELIELIERQKVSIMQATPTTWRMMLSEGWRGDENFKILCGGEPFPVDLANKLKKAGGSVWNMYGPTETTVWSTCHRVEELGDHVPIGLPIDNTSVYILDKSLRPVPYGVEGDLYIGGDGLALGYHNLPELTASSFVKDTVSGKGNLYKTGDLARFNSKGQLICLGRNDGQIKLRGYRIELGEIESRVARLPNIQEAVVVVQNKDSSNPTLTAFIRIDGQNAFNQFEAQGNLAASLPNYMIPSKFVVVEEYPKTLNNKIDRKTLEQQKVNTFAPMDKEQKNTICGNERAKNLIGEVQKIWMETLKVDECNLDDNFFDVGGHSLLAVDLFREIEAKLNVNLPLAILMNDSTLGGLIRAIDPSADLNHEVKAEDHVDLEEQTLFIPDICKCMVPIKKTGKKEPIFIFHSVGGNILNYIGLSKAGGEHLLIGVQALGVDGSVLPKNDLMEMAKLYADEIMLVRPDGPYILAGGSFGGLLALEVGRILLEHGHEVKPLLMFDTFGPGLNLNGTKGFEGDLLQRTKRGIIWRIQRALIKTQSSVMAYLGMPIPHTIRHKNIELCNFEALWKCTIRKYDGDIILIRAPIEDNVWYRDEYMGWREYVAGDIKVSYVNGIHSKFIESKDFLKVFSDAIHSI
ncbi:MAG: hypothetical protein CME64_17360 [Halobacteriovoraceae bacterium]|nr:hypothetical protein [Halobacteriovoraceae bacterium]|tara:strand:+ start:303557 stop:309109 length:5553 start_codon:yes stop_codon:yes gene_type:complete